VQLRVLVAVLLVQLQAVQVVQQVLVLVQLQAVQVAVLLVQLLGVQVVLRLLLLVQVWVVQMVEPGLVAVLQVVGVLLAVLISLSVVS
jgi:hypothetical protein